MKGRIFADSTLVQTFTKLYFELTPTLNLSKNSYIKINVPPSVQF